MAKIVASQEEDQWGYRFEDLGLKIINGYHWRPGRWDLKALFGFTSPEFLLARQCLPAHPLFGAIYYTVVWPAVIRGENIMDRIKGEAGSGTFREKTELIMQRFRDGKLDVRFVYPVGGNQNPSHLIIGFTPTLKTPEELLRSDNRKTFVGGVSDVLAGL